MRLPWFPRKNQEAKERVHTAPVVPEFIWCKESGHTYDWMNQELVELVVRRALEIPIENWREDTLNEKSGYSAPTEKGAQVFLRTHIWKGHGRAVKNDYYIYVDSELIGRFTEVRGDCIDYHYGYTGVEYVCRHVVYEIYEIELERTKPLREAQIALKQREKAAEEARERQQVEEMRQKL